MLVKNIAICTSCRKKIHYKFKKSIEFIQLGYISYPI